MTSTQRRLRRLEHVLVGAVLGLFLMILLAWTAKLLYPRDAPEESRMSRATVSMARPEALTVLPQHDLQTEVGRIRIPLTSDGAKDARFFAYESANRGLIRFFVVDRPNGTPLVALDTCTGCYEHRHGFAQAGSKMICRWCGRLAPIEAIGSIPDKCHPITVSFERGPNELLIDPAELERFDARRTAPPAPER